MGMLRGLALAGLVIDGGKGRIHFWTGRLIVRGLLGLLAGVMSGCQILVSDVSAGLKRCRHIQA